MSTERGIQFSVATMTAVATLMLGMSQQSSLLAPIAIAVAGLSLVFTDIYGWFYVNRHVANVAAVVAVGYAYMTTRDTGLEGQFLGVANLLIHLQIIQLFQKKTERIYWQLIVLALLQVVVAAALNLFFLFGVLLLIYLMATVAALLFFFIHRETGPFLDSSHSETKDSEQALAESPAATAHSSALRRVIAVEGIPDRRRRVFAGCSDVDPRRQLVRSGMVRSFTWIGLTTILVTFLVFTLMPRVGNSTWSGTSGQAVTGFTTQVALDEMTPILESPELVMRVSFFDEWNRRPYTVRGEPYFRGAVLTYYGRDRWSRPSSTQRRNARLEPPEVLVGAVRQDYVLERPARDVLQHIAPAYESAGGEATNIRMDRQGMELVRRRRRDEDPDYDPKRYSLGTTAFRDGTLSQLIPALEPANRIESSFDSFGLDGLQATAASIVADVPESDVWRRIETLESHFFEPGLYRYSLRPHPDRNRAIDAVEDFVTSTRSGHCEYFASALTLMLRSQGIPARMVIGYKGGTYNAVGSYYQVRQLDAHAWVEAYLSADQIPESLIRPHEDLTNGAWVRLDPTPPDGTDEGITRSVWKERMDDTLDYVQLLWNEYVLGLNAKTQKEAIYAPLTRLWHALTDAVFSADTWSSRWQALQDRLRGDTDLIRSGNWFNRQTATDAAIVAVFLGVIYATARYLWSFAWRWMRRWSERQAAIEQSEFPLYRDLEQLLAKYGLHRQQQQTPREFVHRATEQLTLLQADQTAGSLLELIVDAYYQVRYGSQLLDTDEQQRLELRLSELRQTLAANAAPVSGDPPAVSTA